MTKRRIVLQASLALDHKRRWKRACAEVNYMLDNPFGSGDVGRMQPRNQQMHFVTHALSSTTRWPQFGMPAAGPQSSVHDLKCDRVTKTMRRHMTATSRSNDLRTPKMPHPREQLTQPQTGNIRETTLERPYETVLQTAYEQLARPPNEEEPDKAANLVGTHEQHEQQSRKRQHKESAFKKPPSTSTFSAAPVPIHSLQRVTSHHSSSPFNLWSENSSSSSAK